MTLTELLPHPVYLELNGTRSSSETVVSSTIDIHSLLSPEQIARFDHHLRSELFSAEGYVITSQQREGHVSLTVFSKSPAGFYYGQNTVHKVMQQCRGAIPEFIIVDYPAFPLRGVIEGFYGIPWTWDERKEVIEAAAFAGFNTFVFAPPDIHRKVQWREPFPVVHQEKLEQLIRYAHQHHTRFVYEILPLGIDLSSELDYERLSERCRDVLGLGADAVMISFDDTNIYYGKSVRREKAAFGQARIMNRLLEKRGSAKTFFCFVPVEYFGVSATPYLHTIGRELDQAVFVGWSGRNIYSERVSVEDARRFSEIIKRKPFLGHNFPVVDEVLKKRSVTLGPLKGLDSNLDQELQGIAFNFIELPFTSLVSGYTAGDFAWNPHGYTPRESLEQSVALHGKNLLSLSNLNPQSSVDPTAFPDGVSSSIKKRFEHLNSQEIDALRKVFHTMIELEDSLSEGVDPRIYKELKPWIMQGNLTGTLGQLVLDKKMSSLPWKAKVFGALKMVSGYRLGGLAFEDWILREMGFPANLFCYLPALRLVADFFENVHRARHKRPKHIH